VGFPGGGCGEALAGYAVRLAGAAEVTGIHDCGDYYTCPRHRPEYGHVQRNPCGPSEAVAISEPRASREGGYLRSEIGDVLWQFLLSRFRRLAKCNRSRFAVPFRLRREELQFHRWFRTAICQGRGCFVRLLRNAGRTARVRPLPGQLRKSTIRCPEPFFVVAIIRFEFSGCRPGDQPRRQQLSVPKRNCGFRSTRPAQTFGRR
jgi:hypothetical protein